MVSRCPATHRLGPDQTEPAAHVAAVELEGGRRSANPKLRLAPQARWCRRNAYALPHKRLADDAAWQVTTDRVTLVVEPGRRASPSGPVYVGVPYGSRARLIMLYLQSEALKTSSREVSLGSSLRDWLRRMDIAPGGNSIAGVREQAERITRCRLSFQIRGADGRSGLVQQQVVDTAM